MLDEYAEKMVKTAVKWYKGETDHTGLADAIQEYLASQKKEDKVWSAVNKYCNQKQKAEIEPIKIDDTGRYIFREDSGTYRLMDCDEQIIVGKVNEVISAINRMRNEK